MTRKAYMLGKVEDLAGSQGHVLFPWTRGAQGFHTHCRGCGAYVHVRISRQLVNELDSLREDCQARQTRLA